MRDGGKNGHLKAGHDKAFNPAKDIHRRPKADFEHKTDLNEQKKNYKDQDGKVKIENPNFLTNPPKLGQFGKGTSFGGTIPYKEDPYDNKRMLAKKELEENHKLMQEKAFSQRAKAIGNFSNDRQAYGEDIVIPARKPVPERKPLMTHDAAFKPSNPSKTNCTNKTISKFPAYKEDPPKPVLRKKKVEGEDDKPNWRPNHKGHSKPSSSVTTITKNLRCEFPSVFRKGM
jgi:hypothetical protein